MSFSKFQNIGDKNISLSVLKKMFLSLLFCHVEKEIYTDYIKEIYIGQRKKYILLFFICTLKKKYLYFFKLYYLP